MLHLVKFAPNRIGAGWRIGVLILAAPSAAILAQERNPVAVASATEASQGAATLSGLVSSAKTGNMLEGAVIRIPALNRETLTDDGGRFTLTGLPAGPVELVVSYIGLADERRFVTAGKDQPPLRVELATRDVITMGKFMVASEREGNALAIASQQNAPNLKNTIAMDAFGNMPNMGVGELAMRLPGTAATQYDDEGNVGSPSVRGMPRAFGTTTIDAVRCFVATALA